ncbi:unnamed protein product [Calypogeia fissa]
MGFGKKKHHDSHHGHYLKNPHPSLHYHKTYSSHEEAISCWHVQTAAEHHGVSLMQLAKLLVQGINLLSAIVSLIQFV